MVSSNEVKEKWGSILKSNGILDPISQVIVKESGARDEGSGSERQLITITFENPDWKPLNLFGKALTSNPSHTRFMGDVKAFEKEATFLTKYVPAAEEFCRQKGLKENFVLDLFPKCYYGDNKLIVLENIVKNKGYSLVGKDERHDWDAACLALETLAKYHAISYAMIEESGNPEIFFQEYPNLDFESFDHPTMLTMLEPWLKSSLNTSIMILQKTAVHGSTEALDKLTQFLPTNITDYIKYTLKCEPDEIRMLGHGDYWYANMMFLKDPKTGKLVHHKAIDLQLTRYNSPALDLAYYLFTSVKTDVRQNRSQELLQFYLDVLNKVADNLGTRINLSYDTILEQYKKKFRIGFWTALILNYGPGMGLYKDVNMATVDLGEWGTISNKLAEQWINNEQPEIVEHLAKEIVKVVKECCELGL